VLIDFNSVNRVYCLDNRVLLTDHPRSCCVGGQLAELCYLSSANVSLTELIKFNSVNRV